MASAEEAMTVAMREVGPCLRYLPDGETGETDRWVVGIINTLRSALLPFPWVGLHDPSEPTVK
ncbi:MAG: hypothetical protein QOJ06_102 [Pseudonocardiales bacterium]|nr:hypothetical protein [Pseudonocardiales bacterium]